MKPEQFTKLISTTKISASSKTCAALRAVLVDGKRQTEACREIGIARATLCKAMGRIGVKLTYTT